MNELVKCSLLHHVSHNLSSETAFMWLRILFLVISVVSCLTPGTALRETESPTDVSSENETEISLAVIVSHAIAAVSK